MNSLPEALPDVDYLLSLQAEELAAIHVAVFAKASCRTTPSGQTAERELAGSRSYAKKTDTPDSNGRHAALLQALCPSDAEPLSERLK